MGNQMDKVLPGLYLGGFLGANRQEKLKENGITHVLSVHDTAEPQYPQDFVYKCIRVSDSSSENLSAYFAECVDFIHDCRVNGGAVYVHCAAGISRSATITIAYLMTISTLSYDEALAVVQHCREMANPNFGFRMQLKRYSETILEERRRVREKFPSPLAGDDEELRRLLKEVEERHTSPAQRT